MSGSSNEKAVSHIPPPPETGGMPLLVKSRIFTGTFQGALLAGIYTLGDVFRANYVASRPPSQLLRFKGVKTEWLFNTLLCVGLFQAIGYYSANQELEARKKRSSPS